MTIEKNVLFSQTREVVVSSLFEESDGLLKFILIL